jgi:hypothetical protein
MQKRLFALAAAVCVAAVGFADAPVTAWAADTISVDAADGLRVAVAPATLRCCPDWCTGGTNVEGAVAVLKVVSNPGSAQAATSSVPLSVSTGEFDVPYSGAGYLRFILSAEKEGAAIGSLVLGDVSFGVKSAFSTAAAYDGRVGALQEIANAGGSTGLRYDLAWGGNTTTATFSRICVRHAKNGALIDVTTNRLGLADSPEVGELPHSMRNLPWGEYRLLLQEYAGDGSLAMEHLSPEYVVPHVYGTYMIIR